MLSPAVFLDRDGVVNENRIDYVRRWSHFAFVPGALTAIRNLGRLGWPAIVVTNQAAVGRGLLDEATLDEIHRKMCAAVLRAGGRIDLVLSCPHRPGGGCVCRKPQPGLLFSAAQKLNIDLGSSYFIGDSENDLEAARQAGLRFVLVRTGLGNATLAARPGIARHVDHVAHDLLHAARWILSREGIATISAEKRRTA